MDFTRNIPVLIFKKVSYFNMWQNFRNFQVENLTDAFLKKNLKEAVFMLPGSEVCRGSEKVGLVIVD